RTNDRFWFRSPRAEGRCAATPLPSTGRSSRRSDAAPRKRRPCATACWHWPTGWQTSPPDGVRAYQAPLLPDDDAGLVGYALVEVDHVLVHQPNTAGRDRLADGIPFRRAVQPVERVLAALEDVERARAERIVEAGRLAAVFGRIFGKPRLAGDHL